MLNRVKKNDTVFVISGKDKGKQGTVIKISKKENAAVVKDVAIVTRHVKARKSGEKNRIVKEEGLIPLCKIMPVCNVCKKPCRVRAKFLENGNKTRVCCRCKEAF